VLYAGSIYGDGMSDALLSPGCHWISAFSIGGVVASAPVPIIRKAFELEMQPVAARLHITALGLYNAEINGAPIGDQVFAPGWTDYRKRVPVQVWDVTAHLLEGENVLGVFLGDGWYCGHVAWIGRRGYGDRPALRACLELDFSDGSKRMMASDASWLCSTGAILQSDFLMGEEFDARLEQVGWSSPGFRDTHWRETEVVALEQEPELCDAIAPPVRRIEEIQPDVLGEKSIWLHRKRFYDFRQNFSGRIRVRINGPKGAVVRFRYAEVLNPDGTLYTENLRSARATDIYVCAGDGEAVWEPRFTFHGFRYVEVDISQLESDSTLEVTGVVLHSDTRPTGSFQCSNPLLNQLQKNIVWGQKGNFLEVPTDCPQRDERLGWTGDAQVFIRTACFNMDVREFFHKWMRDARDAQSERGGIPPVIPNNGYVPGQEDGGPAWSDANIICPWVIYLCYADKQILEDHYESMQRYLDFLLQHQSIGLIRSHPDLESWKGYGDWLALDGSSGLEGQTPKDLIGTAYFAHVAELMAKIARVLGLSEDAEKYDALHREIVEAFQNRFIAPGGLLVSGTQTAYVLALNFDLFPESMRAEAAAELVRDIKNRDYHLSTGFVGTPHLLDVLEGAGYLDVAYRLLEQETFPSWLFPVKNGATTVWERWNGWTPEQGFQDASMNSFNHYAYGAVGSWMVRSAAGLDLDPQDPGYRHIIFRPKPGGSLTWAEARLETPFGLASIRWDLAAEKLKIRLEVPGQSGATFFTPSGFQRAEGVAEPHPLGPGIHEFALDRR
jgi:alpha-L-rhamnosidase